MTSPPTFAPRRRLPALVQAAALLLALTQAVPAHADERSELQQLRATTLALIDALVQQGLLTRERADTIVRQAQGAAVATAAPAAPGGPAASAPGWGTPLPAAGTAAVAPGVVRVPYVSETLRAQLREEIKNEVMATAREERWADPRALPDWLRGISFEGDVRVRAQGERFPNPQYAPGVTDPCDTVGGNLPAECFRAQVGSPAWGPDLLNNTIDRGRMTLRARLGVNAKVSDDTSLALRLTTGTTSGPSSSSQTLGTNFNKASVVLDRAFVRWEPRYDVRLLAGRMANPFFGSDLLWPDDLSLDGVAAQTEQNLAPGIYAFATAGVFPLEEFNVDRRDKWLYGVQVGANWALGASTELRLGAAVYDFSRIEGVRETGVVPGVATAGTVPFQTSQYPSSVRLKGNTLINLNNPNDPTASTTPVWGLASRFRPFNLNAVLALRQFNPFELNLGLDIVKNTGFDLADIRARAGAGTALDNVAGKTTGIQLKAQFGKPRLVDKGDWQVMAALRQFERDAWPDGFTDTTWNLGGTNYKGWQLGGGYAFDRRTTLGLRLTSTRNLDDGFRFGNGLTDLRNAPMKIDVIQLDLNTRF